MMKKTQIVIRTSKDSIHQKLTSRCNNIEFSCAQGAKPFNHVVATGHFIPLLSMFKGNMENRDACYAMPL